MLSPLERFLNGDYIVTDYEHSEWIYISQKQNSNKTESHEYK